MYCEKQTHIHPFIYKFKRKHVILIVIRAFDHTIYSRFKLIANKMHCALLIVWGI
jgi:hypothetical protein